MKKGFFPVKLTDYLAEGSPWGNPNKPRHIFPQHVGVQASSREVSDPVINKRKMNVNYSIWLNGKSNYLKKGLKMMNKSKLKVGLQTRFCAQPKHIVSWDAFKGLNQEIC
jgi:hypothetical protein